MDCVYVCVCVCLHFLRIVGCFMWMCNVNFGIPFKLLVCNICVVVSLRLMQFNIIRFINTCSILMCKSFGDLIILPEKHWRNRLSGNNELSYQLQASRYFSITFDFVHLSYTKFISCSFKPLDKCLIIPAYWRWQPYKWLKCDSSMAIDHPKDYKMKFNSFSI